MGRALRQHRRRLRQSDRLRAEHGAYPAATRIARVLADLALCHGEPVSDPLSDAVAVLINQQELAGAAGTSRESVARTIRQLQAAGLVSTARGATVVPDPGALRRWTGD